MDVLKLRVVLACAAVAVTTVVSAGCKPDLDQRASRIAGTRVLAVRAEPAEAEPRDAVNFTALIVDATGRADAAPVPTWAFCTARKPLAELGPVSPKCYSRAAADSFLALGGGARVAGAMPSSACRDFGPEVPTAKPGEPYGRPVDPDPTGGYYQPLTLFVGAADGEIAVETTRISCGVAGASSDDVISFRQRYHANENPRIDALGIGDVAMTTETAPVPVARGARVKLHVTWPACPAVDTCGDGICGPDETRIACAADCGKPVGCMGAERYLYFDAETRQLVARRESMRVSWFASAGTFDRDRTGRASDDAQPSSDDEWDAPEEAMTVRGWVVLRDDRGGIAWRGFVIDVR
jgi:hypothetical protein